LVDAQPNDRRAGDYIRAGDDYDCGAACNHGFDYRADHNRGHDHGDVSNHHGRYPGRDIDDNGLEGVRSWVRARTSVVGRQVSPRRGVLQGGKCRVSEVRLLVPTERTSTQA
jgi:hypothetical protein